MFVCNYKSVGGNIPNHNNDHNEISNRKVSTNLLRLNVCNFFMIFEELLSVLGIEKLFCFNLLLTISIKGRKMPNRNFSRGFV